MTREEIIALAKECGASAYTNRHYQDETYMTFSPEKLEAFFHAAQALERDACAMEAERMKWYPGGHEPAPAHDSVWHAARAIRNRGTP